MAQPQIQRNNNQPERKIVPADFGLRQASAVSKMFSRQQCHSWIQLNFPRKI